MRPDVEMATGRNGSPRIWLESLFLFGWLNLSRCRDIESDADFSSCSLLRDMNVIKLAAVQDAASEYRYVEQVGTGIQIS